VLPLSSPAEVPAPPATAAESGGVTAPLLLRESVPAAPVVAREATGGGPVVAAAAAAPRARALVDVGYTVTVAPLSPLLANAPKPYFANVMMVFLQTYAIGHFLRALTYLSTALPGSAKHCRPWSHELDPPKSVAECFTRVTSMYGSCGDLNFSGHALLMCLSTLFVNDYARRLWPQLTGLQHTGLVALAVALLLVQYVTILGARHHYTVDIVLASMVTPLLWHHVHTRFRAHRALPDYSQILAEIERERHQSVLRRVASALLGVAVGAASLFALILVMKGNVHWLFRAHDPHTPHPASQPTRRPGDE